MTATPNPDALVEVIQADRAFAASYLCVLGVISPVSQEPILAGEWDRTSHVQRVAHHRLATLADHQDLPGKMYSVAGALDRRIRRLEAALRVARGYVLRTDDQQSSRDMATIDAALTPTKDPA